ncbi:MAG: hypothetical protein P4L45_15320 [Ignavibacteriaceae bacterium]|nr:hypothetical protein [Ignavibacteriaceae bacterium]
MKNKVIYIFIFTVAFVFTTGAIVYFNSIYKNIFQFNFTSAYTPDPIKAADSTATMNASVKANVPDTVKAADSLSAANVKNSTPSANPVQNVQNIIKPAENKASVTKTQAAVQPTVNNTPTKPDTNYISWMKQTAKLYENMDAKKAAKIIQSYSDNIARDIIYSMKQKKAAEILSEINPDAANRITRAKSNAF